MTLLSKRVIARIGETQNPPTGPARNRPVPRRSGRANGASPRSRIVDLISYQNDGEGFRVIAGKVESV
jgi:hypothetical protein